MNEIGAATHSAFDHVGFLDSLPLATIVCDHQSRILNFNPSFLAMFLLQKFDVSERVLEDVLTVDGQKISFPFKGEPKSRFERCLARKDGTTFLAELFAQKIEDPLSAERYIVQFSDISEFKAPPNTISQFESSWRHASIVSKHGIWDYTKATGTWFYSDEWKSLRGIPLDEKICIAETSLMDRIHPDDLDRAKQHIQLHYEGKIPEIEFEYREKHRDGHWIWVLSRGGPVEWDEDGNPTRFSGSDVDISDIKNEQERKANEVRVLHDQHVAQLGEARRVAELARKKADNVSRTDPLTGMSNRREFGEQLDALCQKDKGQEFALLLIDLDRFKPINDIYGHITGDLVLCCVAKRIKDVIGAHGIVARLGGDEFAVILYETTNRKLKTHARSLAGEIKYAVSSSIRLETGEVEVGASIGISYYPSHGVNAQDMMRAADVAMYDVKKSQKGDFAVYTSEMGNRKEALTKLETGVRKAVIRNQIEPHFQPVLNLANSQIAGFEILARWQRTDGDIITADKFIPTIEKFGQMKTLTRSLLRQACIAASDWPEYLDINLNVSGWEICDPELPKRIFSVLDETGFSPERLGVEITESSQLVDLNSAAKVTQQLRTKGIKILLDDFGIGYSGIDYLQRFELDCIKLDRSFVMRMQNSRQNEKIVHSILELAARFGLSTIAEGIENLESHDRLRESGCLFGQGFYYSKAVPAGRVLDMIAASKSGLSKTVLPQN